MDGDLSALLARAAGAPQADGEDDRTVTRILDAAVLEAAAVGLGRLTVEDVVRRAGHGRMTVYRRVPRRDDLVAALVARETRRFLALVAEAMDRAARPGDRVVEGFVAAVGFTRTHPMVRRVAETGSAGEMAAADAAALVAMGSAFIAREIHGERPGRPSRRARQVADVFARLFASYVLLPPADPDPADEDALLAFARDVLQPLVGRATTRA
jgi:AcrR family transcriptional regulator